jgi:hypothetical protein
MAHSLERFFGFVILENARITFRTARSVIAFSREWRAAAIKEQIETLNKELRSIPGAPTQSGTTPNEKRTMSDLVKTKIGLLKKLRWAKYCFRSGSRIGRKPIVAHWR